MKKSIAVILILYMFLSSFICFADIVSEPFFQAIEAEEGIFGQSGTYGFRKVFNADDGRSGNYAMETVGTDYSTQVPLCFTVNVGVSGAYKIFVRIKNNNSFDYAINDNPYVRFSSGYPLPTSDYKWTVIDNAVFSQGDNIIKLKANKSGLILDKIIVTNSKYYMPYGLGQDILSGDNGFSRVYPKPSYYPKKGEHPRVIVNTGMLPDIRSSLNLATKNTKRVFETLRDVKVNLTLTEFSGAMNSDWLDKIEANAFMYLISENKENDEIYAKTAIDTAISYLEILDKFNVTTLQEQREMGGAIFVTSIVYDWCYNSPYFTMDKKEYLIDKMVSIARHQQCAWPPLLLSAYDNNQGWENSIIKDLLAFAIAVYDERPEFYDLIAGRVLSEFVPVANYHYENDNFMLRTSDGYYTTRFDGELFMNMLLRGIGCKAVSDKQKNIAYQMIIRTRPDGELLKSGDMVTGGGTGMHTKAYTVLAPAVFLFKDPYLKKWVEDTTAYPHTIKNDAYLQSLMLYLLLNDSNVPMEDCEELPLTVYSGDEQGTMTARTGWSEDDLTVSLRMPEEYFRGHQHLDAGSFEVYYKGALLLDSGIYKDGKTGQAYGSDHYNNYYSRTVAHNAMLVYNPNETDFGIGEVNDGGQRISYTLSYDIDSVKYQTEYLKRKMGEIISVDYGDDLNKPSYSYLRGDISGWYSPDKVSDYQRSFIFYNFFDDTYKGALIVFDMVTSKDKNFKKTYLLHSQNEPEIDGKRTIIKNKTNELNRGRVINDTLFPSDAELKCIGGKGMEYFVGGKNYTAYPVDESTDESGKYRVEISPSEENETDYFLNVMQISDDDDDIMPLDVLKFENEKFLGTVINKKATFFYKGYDKLSDEFTASVEGEDYIEYIFVGIEDGIWEVTIGDIVKTVEVKKDRGILRFEGFAGTVSVKRISSLANERNLNFYKSIYKPLSPFITPFEKIYQDETSVAVFVNDLKDNNFNVYEKGFIMSNNPLVEINDKESYLLKSISTNSDPYGIHLIDKNKKIDFSYYLRPYVKFDDTIVEKTAYGNALYIKGEQISEEKNVKLSDTGVLNKMCSLNQGINTADSNTYTGRIFDSLEDKIGISMSNNDSGTKNNTSLSLMNINISNMKFIDFEKPVYLDLYGCMDNGFGTVTPKPDAVKAYLYAVDNSVWDKLNTDTDYVDALTDISNLIGNLKPVAECEIPVVPSENNLSSSLFDITDYLKTVYGKCDDITLAVYIKMPNGTKENTYFKYRYWYSYSKIIYNAFNCDDKNIVIRLVENN